MALAFPLAHLEQFRSNQAIVGHDFISVGSTSFNYADVIDGAVQISRVLQQDKVLGVAGNSTLEYVGLVLDSVPVIVPSILG